MHMDLPPVPKSCTRRTIGRSRKFQSLRVMKSLKEMFLNPQQDTRLSSWVQLILGSNHYDLKSCISDLWLRYVDSCSSGLNSPYGSHVSCYFLFPSICY